MALNWLKDLSAIKGVRSVHIVDADGLIVSSGGDSSKGIAPHSALMVKNLIEKIGVNTMDGWQWTQCRSKDVIIAISNVFVGILVIVMDENTDLQSVRSEAGGVRKVLLDKFKPQYGKLSGEL